MGNWLGFGSTCVSGQVVFVGYTANNYPRSTFDVDPSVIDGKII